MTTQPKYEFYPKSYGLFGINEPSYGLSLTGKYSQEFEEVRRNIELELQSLPLPFEYIMDAVHSLLGLVFGTLATLLSLWFLLLFPLKLWM